MNKFMRGWYFSQDEGAGNGSDGAAAEAGAGGEGGEGGQGAAAAPAMSQAEIDAMIRDQVAAQVAGIRTEFQQQAQSQQAQQAQQSQAAGGGGSEPLTPFQRAEAEAEARGIQNYDWIANRTAEIAASDTEKRILNMMAPMLGPIVVDRETARVAGDNAHAQEYARRLVAKGFDTSDPDVQDMIRRASSSYAAEKQPSATVTIEGSGNPGPSAQAATLRSEADEMSRIAASALGYGPEDAALLRLTDADLQELAA